MPDHESNEQRGRAGDALRISEAQLRLLVENIRDYAIFMLDPGGHVVSWNLGAQRIKGYTADEIIGHHFSRFYPESDVRAGKCELELEVATEVGRFEDEGVRVRKDGTTFWANVVITALRDAAGELIGFAKVTRDLTERRQAEEERVRLAQLQEASRVKDEYIQRLREAQELAEQARSSLATTLQSIGDAVIATDDHGVVTLMNPVAERLTGWSAAAAQGEPLRSVFHIINEGTRSIVESPVSRILREGVVVGLANHTVLISRDGKEIPISDSGAPIKDESGAIRGVVLVFRDASREQQESARREFLGEATAVLSASLDYRDTLSRVANLVVPRLADWCTIDLVENGEDPVQVAVAHSDPLMVELLHELRRRFQLHPGHQSALERVIRTGQTEHFPAITDDLLAARAVNDEHLRLLRKLVPRSAIVVPLFSGARAYGAISLVFARSGRTYTPEDVEFAEELARRAAATIETARLYAAQQRARDLADAASRAKDEFLALVSHELRTPLSSIVGWTKILSTAGADEKKRARAAETIERNAVAMAQLVDDLLDVSRIVSGKLRLDVTRISLRMVIEAAIESVRPAADAKSIRIEQHVDGGTGPVSGDAARLQQVVWNLLSNAVKFTPAGGSVTVSLRPTGSDAEIVVSDTGKGIEPRFLPEVFEAFRQADSGMARTVGGLGLGLAIVRHLVELHGGHVEAHSEGSGRGATFTVRLPLLTPQAPPRAEGRASVMPADSSASSLPQLAGLRVLVVEDEADMRELLSEVLTERGCHVTTAASVAEAMKHFERADVPDVLLSDISMPGETGYDLIRRVRELPPDRGGSVPAAALTAYTRAEDRRKVLGAGFELHVPKPLDAAELLTVLATLARLAKK